MRSWLPLLALTLPAVAVAQEPAACLSLDPTAWPARSKPYFLILADTGQSMATSATGTSSCGLGSTRLGHLRCALRQTFEAYSGVVSFGLGTPARTQASCAPACSCNVGDPSCFAACTTYSCAPAELATRGTCVGCGPKPGAADTASGAEIRIPLRQDNFWTSPPSADNAAALLSWVDGACTGNAELFADGAHPLNGMLRDAERYFAGSYVSPLAGTAVSTPLAVEDRACRSINVVLITSADEDCDSQADVVQAAASLFTNGVTVGGKTFTVRVHVINFSGASQLNADAIAAAGGTTAAMAVQDDVQLSQALSTIVLSAVPDEVCDNSDNDCNGCTDEGYSHFADVQPLPADCCPAFLPILREICLSNFRNSITPSLPGGNLSLLPCTSPAQQQVPSEWLCYDPTERCDGIDNNGNGAIDEGTVQCGTPAHCPLPEVLNGLDDDCDGAIDNGVGGPCIRSPEICDGCDNDCDGLADNNVSTAACGFSSPANCSGTLSCGAVQPVPVGDCVPGGRTYTCSNAPAAEVCDNLDNDCDGVIDDEAHRTPCGGGLINGGTSACRRGFISCSAQCLGSVEPVAEYCNGIDDDCDGVVDEGIVLVGTPCGINPCARGTFQCTAGNLVCVGDGPIQPETCNGLDDDCNGYVDDAFGEGAECDASGQPGRSECNPVTGARECVAAPVCTGAGGGGGSGGGSGGGGAGGNGGGTSGGAGGAAGGTSGGTGGAAGGTSGGTGGAAGGTSGGTGGAAGGTSGGTGGAAGGTSGGTGGAAGGTSGGTGGAASGSAGGTGGAAGGSAGGTGGAAGGSAGGTGGAAGGSAGGTGGAAGAGGSTGGTGGTGGGDTGKGCGCNADPAAGSFAFALVLFWRRRREAVVLSGLAVTIVLGACTTNDSGAQRPSATLTQAVICTDAGCGDIAIDPANCGACGAGCQLPNAVAGCSAGHCVVTSCLPGYRDGDRNPSNGCECTGTAGFDPCNGIDDDCNGIVDDGYDRNRDPANCGPTCTSCPPGSLTDLYACVNGVCERRGCRAGYAQVGGACVRCVPTGAEVCNGLDDDCDGAIDQGLSPPSSSVCGVSPVAASPECTSQVAVACVNGAWQCTFPPGVCNPTCATALEICDSLDNNCNAALNENVPNYGAACASDEGLPLPGHGRCRTTGTVVCDGPNASRCSAVKADCNTLDGGCTELCDGVDNDCDGLVDEPFDNKGTDTVNFVKPAVTRVASAQWIYSYEASRPSATASTAGSGNGYWTSAPVGSTLDRTPACSSPQKLPWSRVTASEAEQTCAAMGGTLCTPSAWSSACATPNTCNWGYAPRTSACTSSFTGTKFCNLGPSHDSQPANPGDQDSVLPVASAALGSCYADWAGLLGNGALSNKVFDVTGNLRELTRNSANDYRAMGGSYLTGEAGARCSTTGASLPATYSAPDLGFRCCFSVDPTQ